MSLDLTQSPEVMAALEKALVVAAARAEVLPPRRIAPEDDWLTGQEAMAYLRLKETAFRDFRERYKKQLVYTHSVSDRDARYQLASLQAIMRAKAVGLPEAGPLPALHSRSHPANGHAARPGSGRSKEPAVGAPTLFDRQLHHTPTT